MSIGDEESVRAEALKEYYTVQDAIKDYDNRSFQIKSWSITVASASTAAGLTQNAPSLFLLAALASIGFWLVDGLWKSFQVVWLNRGTTLEQMLSSEGLGDYRGPGIHASFRKRFKSIVSWLYVIPCMFRANVYLPHLPIAVGMTVFFWWYTGMDGFAAILQAMRPN